MLRENYALAPALLWPRRMERILAGIDAIRPSWEAVVRALCLAGRIQARVAVLAVFAPGSLDSPEARAVLKEARERIGRAKEAGTHAELFLAEGRFDQEIIDAAGNFQSTLLVVSAPGEGPGRERETEALNRILRGADCGVELVSPKKDLEGKKEGL